MKPHDLLIRIVSVIVLLSACSIIAYFLAQSAPASSLQQAILINLATEAIGALLIYFIFRFYKLEDSPLTSDTIDKNLEEIKTMLHTLEAKQQSNIPVLTASHLDSRLEEVKTTLLSLESRSPNPPTSVIPDVSKPQDKNIADFRNSLYGALANLASIGHISYIDLHIFLEMELITDEQEKKLRGYFNRGQ